MKQKNVFKFCITPTHSCFVTFGSKLNNLTPHQQTGVCYLLVVWHTKSLPEVMKLAVFWMTVHRPNADAS